MQSGVLADRSQWASQCQARKTEASMQRKTHFDTVPIKPQRVYEEMNRAFDANTRYVSTIGLSQIDADQFLTVYTPRNWTTARQEGHHDWSLSTPESKPGE